MASEPKVPTLDLQEVRDERNNIIAGYLTQSADQLLDTLIQSSKRESERDRGLERGFRTHITPKNEAPNTARDREHFPVCFVWHS